MDVCKDPKWMEGTKGLALEHKDPKGREVRKEENDGYKVPKWTWNMDDGNLWVWMEEFWIWKE